MLPLLQFLKSHCFLLFVFCKCISKIHFHCDSRNTQCHSFEFFLIASPWLSFRTVFTMFVYPSLTTGMSRPFPWPPRDLPVWITWPEKASVGVEPRIAEGSLPAGELVPCPSIIRSSSSDASTDGSDDDEPLFMVGRASLCLSKRSAPKGFSQTLLLLVADSADC